MWPKDYHEEITQIAGNNVGLPEYAVDYLVYGNRGTDSGSTGPLTATGRPYHFNNNPPGQTDSRKELADYYFERAVNVWSTNEAQAWRYLGVGLHAIQDYHAHGQIDAGPRNILGTGMGVGHAPHSILVFIFEVITAPRTFANISVPNPMPDPDSSNFTWDGDSRTRLIRYFGGFDTNPRVLDSITDSEVYLWRFMEAVGLEPTCSFTNP